MTTPVRTALASGVLAPAKPPAAGTGGPLPIPEPDDIRMDPNPFTEGDWRMLSYAWTGFALRLFLVFGAIFSVFQFLEAREEKRVERTLALVELWERPDYQDAQKALKQRLADLNQTHADLLGDSASADELALYQERIGIAALTPEGGSLAMPEFRDRFDRIVYFLNRVASCVAANLCSRQVADDYFRDFAVSFWGYFSGVAARERKSGAPNFAAPIEAYVENTVDQPDMPSAANAEPVQ